MTFHRTDRAEYIRSDRKLWEEMLKLLVEYFESIYNSRLSEGLVLRRQLEKILADAKREMRHELQEQYDCKLCHFLEQRRFDRLCSMQCDNGHC